jgi:hypothetical protein
VPSDRDEMMSLLRQRLASQPPAIAAAPHMAAASDDDAVKDVADADRAVYAQATQKEHDDPEAAWKVAQPLFGRYPSVYAVQDLRCRLAMRLTNVWQMARRECEQLMDLTRGKPAKAK